MSFDVVFVHGTGVREPSYSKVFNIISKKLKARNNNLRVHKCYWGGTEGATLNAGGDSIPGFDTNRDIDQFSDKEFTLSLWQLLYQDPLFELQTLLCTSSKLQDTPGEEPLGIELDELVRIFIPSSELQQMLTLVGIDLETFKKARKNLVTEKDYIESVASASQPLGEYRVAIARALLAQSLILLQKEYGYLVFSLNADLRDHIVEKIVDELGGQDKGIGERVKKALSGTFKRIATNYGRSKRGKISEDISGGGGDILKYQARGQNIRNYIRSTISSLPGPIVLIGHSLGGIACVDLLLEKDPPNIHLLVTVGSQAPVLYELDALVNMSYDPNGTLPTSFPKWLNIYDENDFLSYIGKNVFPNRVEDVEVKSGQPFPESHCAYWNNDQVWNSILSKIG